MCRVWQEYGDSSIGNAFNAPNSIAFKTEIGPRALNGHNPCNYLSSFLEICSRTSSEAQVNICSSFPCCVRIRPPLQPLSRGSGFVVCGSRGFG